MFPRCSHYLACTRNGQVIYRVCDDPASPRHRQCVRASTCLECKAGRRDSAPPPPKTKVSKRNLTKEVREKTPSIPRRIISYAEAVVEWTAAGRPERSEEEVKQIFQQFCEPCKSFDPGKNICQRCGCRVASDGFAIFNKIKMATQHCPRNLW